MFILDRNNIIHDIDDAYTSSPQHFFQIFIQYTTGVVLPIMNSVCDFLRMATNYVR
jgi:hypothetical protein